VATPDPGYSGTPLAKKLGIKAGHELLLVNAPTGWKVPDLPDGVKVHRGSNKARTDGSDVIIAFFATAARLTGLAPDIAGRLPSDSAFWVAWPRRAGGHTSDITDGLVRQALLPIGVVDVKVAAIDTDWSGLKFVWRLENRS
jgi:hypothetical protein